MTPAAFTYTRPTTLAEALGLLDRPDARLLAGGQSLVPLMAQRLQRPSLVIDINRLPDLDRITLDAGWISIGALVRLEQARQDPLVRRLVPLLAEALGWVANPGVRRRGTVVGNLAHNGPGTELAAVALVLGARLAVARSGAAPECLDAAIPLATAGPLRGFITHVLWPAAGPDDSVAFHEAARRPGHVGLVGAAVCRSPMGLRVALSGLCATALPCAAVAACLASSADRHALALALAQDVGQRRVMADALSDAAGRLALAPWVVATAARRAIDQTSAIDWASAKDWASA